MNDHATIFIGCSQRDEASKDLIVSQLGLAERQIQLEVWDDRRMDSGVVWRAEFERAIDAADIGVLFISPHFLASAFAADHDMGSILERRQRKGLRLYPILLGSCEWNGVDWLGRLNGHAVEARPLDSFEDARRASQASSIASEIWQLLEQDKESRMQIEKLCDEANALGERLGVTEEVAQSLLTILHDRHVKRVDLREKLNEITRQYFETITQFSGLTRDDPSFANSIDNAKSAFTAGDFDQAEELLTQAENHELGAASQKTPDADRRRLNAAAARALRGETDLTRLRYLEAAEHFSLAAASVPDERHVIKADYLSKQGFALSSAQRSVDAIAALEHSVDLDPSRIEPLLALGRLHEQAGKLTAAETTFEAALKAAKRAQQRRETARSYMRLGDVGLGANDLESAQNHYKNSQRIRLQLASEHTDDDEIQQEASEILEKVGDIHRRRGAIDDAYSAYTASLTISRKIIEKNRKKLDYYPLLAKRLRNIGDIHVDRGDLEDALADYRESFRMITEDVIEKEQRKHRWHRELTVCHNKIGDVLRALGDLDGALEEYEAGLGIRELAVGDDPSDAKWRHDLLASSNKIGCVRFAKGDLTGALKAYEDSQEIALHLANSDPDHNVSQSELSITYEKVGDVSMELADYDRAFEAYKAADVIRRDLAEREPGNAAWQRGLIISRAKLAGLAEARRLSDAALGNWREALTIASELKQSGRLAPDDAWMVDDLQGRIDALTTPAGSVG